MQNLAEQDKTILLLQEKKIYKSENSSFKSHGLSGFTLDLLIFLGSVFYPKDMVETLDYIGFLGGRQKVEQIHKTLYGFSHFNLHNLLLKNAAFRYILGVAYQNRHEIFFGSKSQKIKEV